MSRYEYALYKGETFIDVGTKEYLSNLLNVTTNYIKWLASPTALKRRRKGDESNTLMCVHLNMKEIERELDENIL